MTPDLESRLRALPKVGDVLEAELGRALLSQAPRPVVVAALREEVERLRGLVRQGGEPVLDEARLRAAIAARVRPSLSRVINATGVVLHTNLGRAPLAEAALARVVEVARGYSNLEYRLDERRRGSRHEHAAQLLRELTGAEAAVVVNNCAGAVLLALSALAAGRGVVVSRGELVEIGGGFRVPDVMAQSGARLVEVGTTNRTRIADYARALDATPDARLLMKVHRSNFAIVGFTECAGLVELVELGRARGVPVFVDLGAGALAPLAMAGAPDEPTVRGLIEAGAELVAFSGDKLLGGPQAGILVGTMALIEAVVGHPLMRALRPDKLSLAALEGTLALYRDGRAAEVPALAMLAATEPALEARARALCAALAEAAPRGRFTAVRVRSAVGGGALPTVEPWSWAVEAIVEGKAEEALDAALRAGDPPVVGRIADGRLLLDVRTIAERELGEVCAALQRVTGA